jgi:hypothetical protein
MKQSIRERDALAITKLKGMSWVLELAFAPIPRPLCPAHHGSAFGSAFKAVRYADVAAARNPNTF